MDEVYACMDDPNVPVIVSKKSAQIAWTEIVNNYFGKRIHNDPCNIIVMFAKEKAGKNYEREKFVPMVEATPVLRECIDTSRSRLSGNTWDHKNFPGGFIKFITSNSPSDVKSTAAPVIVVEEPDDANGNVKGQGNTIKLLMERTKTFPDSKVIYGGTPTIKGVSNVDDAYEKSDQRIYKVPCHHCSEEHELSFDNLDCREYADGYVHPVYQDKNPEDAYYSCPHCGGIWSDYEKNQNVANGHWEAQQKFQGVAGFRFNELMSPFAGSRFADLMKKKLEARHKLKQGDQKDWISFVNNSMGEGYEYESDTPDIDALKKRIENYQEKFVPRGGLVLTCAVDVQHNRFAVKVKAWGREMESWLVLYTEIFGDVTDKHDPVWKELDEVVFQPFEHESGVAMHVSAVGIDSGDGSTNSLVYDWVRRRQTRNVVALKGDPNDTGNKEIFTKPRSLDVNGRNDTKAAKYGLRVYMVGTNKAKDDVFARMRLTGDGPGRMHFYNGVDKLCGSDGNELKYFNQLAESELKAPNRSGRLVYQQRPGRPNEALDTEVYNLHQALRLKLHRMTPGQWDDLEQQMLQADMFAEKSAAPTVIDDNEGTGFTFSRPGA